MPGTLPATAPLLTRNGIVIGIFESYGAVAAYLRFQADLHLHIDGEGCVILRGKVHQPSYRLKRPPDDIDENCWEESDALRDWCQHHLNSSNSFGYRIYRFLR